MKFVQISDKYDLKYFECIRSEVNDYFFHNALVDNEKKVTKTKVVIDDNNRVLAFCTVGVHLIRSDEKKKLVDFKEYSHKIPALFIMQVGVDKRYKGQNIGKSMIKEIFKMVPSLLKYLNIPYIYLEAADDSLVKYYSKMGFRRFSDSSKKMYLSTIEILENLKKIKNNQGKVVQLKQ